MSVWKRIAAAPLWFMLRAWVAFLVFVCAVTSIPAVMGWYWRELAEELDRFERGPD